MTPSLNTVNTMTVVPQTLKDSKVLFLRAEVSSVNATVDGIVTEISKHISDMEQAKLDGDLPQDILFSYSNMLK